jgi:hypothetical protein
LTTIIVVAYCWSKGTLQSYASSINKHYYYCLARDVKQRVVYGVD